MQRRQAKHPNNKPHGYLPLLGQSPVRDRSSGPTAFYPLLLSPNPMHGPLINTIGRFVSLTTLHLLCNKLSTLLLRLLLRGLLRTRSTGTEPMMVSPRGRIDRDADKAFCLCTCLRLPAESEDVVESGLEREDWVAAQAALS